MVFSAFGFVPRDGCFQPGGQFEILWTAALADSPMPYPPWRTAEQWRVFLHDLYLSWGIRWSAPIERLRALEPDPSKSHQVRTPDRGRVGQQVPLGQTKMSASEAEVWLPRCNRQNRQGCLEFPDPHVRRNRDAAFCPGQ